MLGFTENEPIFAMFDENGLVRVHLSASNNDWSALGLLDGNGRLRVSLKATNDWGGINLCDENVQPRVSLNASNDGGGHELDR